MITKIKGEAPFQILASSFSISPSLQNYVLQISADGVNYSDLFTVSAGQTKMCTGMANGSYYRLKNNASDVSINWRTQCNDGQGGGGSSTYAESAGTADYANSTKLLEGSSALPESGNTGDVVAVAPAPALLSTRGTKGLRSANTALGIYQYDGTDWNPIGGEGSSAYKIELSAVNPEDYTAQDRANLNAFFAAYSADNSIADTAYIYALEGIYRCVRYLETQQTASIAFEGTYNNNIVNIWLHFANNSYSYGGVQDAVQTPDITTLKSVSEIPSNLENGDVFALVTPAVEGTWEKFDSSASPKKVRIITKSDGTYLLHFDNNNLYTGLDYTAGDPPTFSGEGWNLTQDDTYEWHYYDNGYYIKVWVEEEKGEWFIYAEMTQGEGGFSTLDAYQLGSDSQMYVGEEPEKVGVYQRYIGSVKVVTVSYPECSDQGGGRWQGTNVRVEITGTPDGEYYLTEYERFEDTAELRIDGTNLWLYDKSTGNNVFSIPITGGTGGGMFSGGYIMVTYDNVQRAFTFVSFQELAYNDQGAVVMGEGSSDIELAKKEDLPADNLLVPQGWDAAQLLMSNGSEQAPIWFSRNSILVDTMRDAYEYDENDGLKYLGRNGYYDIGWKSLEVTELKPSNTLPSQGTDHSVYADANGVYQAQSSHTQNGWYNFEDKQFPSGVTKIRVPVNDGNESSIVNFKTDENGSGNACLYWHPEDPNDQYWDINMSDNWSKESATFSIVDDWGNTISAVSVGDYIEVTFGAALVPGDGDNQVSTFNNLEAYAPVEVTDYANVITSFDIKRIVKITQADYDALVSGGTVDANTFYIIVANNS